MTEDLTKKPLLRIGVFTSTLMIVVALIYDGAQVLVELVTFGLGGWLINPLINIWSLMTFSLWFSLKGVSFARPSKALTLGGTSVAEMIPFINDLPTWTAGVIIILAQTYAEDLAGKFSPLAAKTLGHHLLKSHV